jgi:hypothetical protein
MNEPISFVITLDGDADIAIPKSGTIYTDSFHFGDVNEFALSYKVFSAGIPNIKIQMEQAIAKPATENAADDAYGVPKTVGDIETALTSKTIQHMQLTPVTLPYIRFKITEQTDLVEDTVINIWLTLQKKFTM